MSTATQQAIGAVLLLMVAAFLVVWGTWEWLDTRRHKTIRRRQEILAAMRRHPSGRTPRWHL